MSVPFRTRVRAGERLVGTFLKTPSAIIAELLALSPLDCIVIDGEHAPFGRAELDLCLMALHGAQKPALVRVASRDPAHMAAALDGGAAGVVVPHIASASEARACVRACHYGPGGRGFAASPRGAGYTSRTVREQRDHAAASTTIIGQIEDASALDTLDEILGVPGLDGILIGRMDLAVSLGAQSPSDPAVVAAVEKIVDASRSAGVAVGMFVPNATEVPRWLERGVTLFFLASDQQFVMEGARALAAAVHDARPGDRA